MNDKTIKAPFTEGSIMKHVLKTTFAGTVGLIAIFAVDVLNLYYIARLGNVDLTAAIGFASLVGFLQTSICIGLMIAAGALVGRLIGAGNRIEAERMATSSLIITIGILVFLSILLLIFTPEMLDLMGAKGVAKAEAAKFIYITTPTTIFIGLGMGCSGLLRSYGDVKRSSYVTLTGAIVTVFTDPFLILYMDWQITGAAIATNISRVVFAIVGFYWLVKYHNFKWTYDAAKIKADLNELFKIALPAILTNTATPVGLSIATGFLARFGEEAVVGFTIINRLVPMAFCAYFTLSGAVGAVVAQNYGANKIDRVEQCLKDAFIVVVVYGVFAWTILAYFAEPIAMIFKAKGDALSLTIFFCVYASIFWVFTGLLFVANAAFNNLGYPLTSTFLNWGRALIGSVPVMWLGSTYASSFNLTAAEGAVFGQSFISVIFAILGYYFARRLILKLKARV